MAAKRLVVPITVLAVIAITAATLAIALSPDATGVRPSTAASADARAVFAGGCFWCMESEFEELDGISEVVSGYSGGATPNPTYAAISAGSTGHLEVIEVRYDPSRISYERLLDVYWSNVDPTVDGRQFCDVGEQYSSAIFVGSGDERAKAEASLRRIASDPRFAGRTLYTEIRDAAPFYPAEDYHQDYAKRNPLRYGSYRLGCGRDARLEAVWGSDRKVP